MTHNNNISWWAILGRKCSGKDWRKPTDWMHPLEGPQYKAPCREGAPCLYPGFSQVSVQASCRQPLIEEHHCILLMLPYKLFIWAGPIAHFECPLFKAWLHSCLHRKGTILAGIMSWAKLTQSRVTDVPIWQGFSNGLK